MPKKKKRYFDYDGICKILFTHKEILKQLLCFFPKNQWALDHIDFSTITDKSSEFITGYKVRKGTQFGSRRSDLIYEVKLKDGKPLYIFILLEFQSKPCRFMPIRMGGYVTLVHQKFYKLHSHIQEGELPRIWPVVFYLGDEPWDYTTQYDNCLSSIPDNAPTDHGPFAYPLKMSFQLINLMDYSETYCRDLKMLVGLIALVFKAKTLNTKRQSALQLLQWLNSEETKRLEMLSDLEYLARDVYTWLDEELFQGKDLRDDDLRVLPLEEIGKKMRQRLQELPNEYLEEGLQKGRQEGRQEGKVELIRAMVTDILQLKFGPDIIDYWQRHISHLPSEKQYAAFLKIQQTKNWEDLKRSDFLTSIATEE